MEFIDLKQLRIDAGLSQQAMADHLGVSVEQIEAYEQDPDEVSSGKARAWQAHCSDVANNRGVTVGLPRAQIQKNAQQVLAYIQTEPMRPDAIPATSIPVSSLIFVDGIQQISRKPRVGVFGKFNAGKSTLCNIILGGGSLPASYIPTTSVICLLRHMDDKPKWQSENVWIFRKGFDLDLVDHEQHSKVHKINAGGYELLAQQGTHEGQATFKKNKISSMKDHTFDLVKHVFRGNSRVTQFINNVSDVIDQPTQHDHSIEGYEKPFAAVVYLDSPLLKGCDLLDSPGYGHSDDDHARAEMGHKMVDALLYISSSSSSFFDQNDMNHLSVLMKHLPIYETKENQIAPLRNLLIVATRANDVGADITNVLNKASKRSFHHHDLTLHAREEMTNVPISLEAYRQRFFTFESNNPSLRSAMINDLEDLLVNVLPNSTLKHMSGYVQGNKELLEQQSNTWINRVTMALEEREQAVELVKEFDREEPARKKSRNEERESQKNRLEKCKEASGSAASKVMSGVASEAAIETMIKRRYTNATTHKVDMEQAKKEASSYLIELMQSKADEYMKNDTKPIVIENMKLVNLYEKNSESIYSQVLERKSARNLVFDNSVGITLVPLTYGLVSVSTTEDNKRMLGFDAQGVFRKAMSTTPGYSSVIEAVDDINNKYGRKSAKVVAYTTLTLIWLGNGTLNLAVDAWDGIANWWNDVPPEQRLAKTLVKFVEREKVKDAIKNREIQYWTDIEVSFDKAIQQLDYEYLKEIKSLRLLSKSDQKILKVELTFAQALRTFFAGIPNVIQKL